MEVGIKAGILNWSSVPLKLVIAKVTFITKRSEGRDYVSGMCAGEHYSQTRKKGEIGRDQIELPLFHCFINYVLKEFGLQDSMMWFHLTQGRIILPDESDSWERISIGFENSFRVSAKQYLILKRSIII